MEHCEECNHNESSKLEMVMYIVAITIFIISFAISNNLTRIIIQVATILLSGYEVLISGIKNLFKFNFKEDTLMTIASIAAVCLGEFPEACMILLLFKLGEILEKRIEKKSEKSIEGIVKIKEENTNLILQDGRIEIIKTENVKVGDRILIKPGEKVPLDSRVLSGRTRLDTSAITGESMTKEVTTGDAILSRKYKFRW